ncbi:MAG: alpha/beta fold hydrolase [Leptolyngbyaceae cyanobacterium bins.59]|nr:alpha/beta fold hydrolase [Leptolyngbyaceae cyanobacterium bins.59]
MVSIEKQVLSVGSLEWFYRECRPVGEITKPPVLLLHGLVSQSYSWRSALPALAEQGFWAIAPDWIGGGFSAKPDRRDFAYTPAAFEKALEELLQALEISSFYLVVQGFLGSVGLQYALHHPEQVERLAIFNTPLSASVKLPWRIKQMGLPLVGDMMTQDPLLVDRTLEGAGPYQVTDEALDIYRRPFLQSSDAGRSLLATIQNLQLSASMAEIEQGFKGWPRPTLVAWGVQDSWLPLELGRNFAAALSDGEFLELSEVGHYAQEDWPEKVNEALIPFLRRQAL